MRTAELAALEIRAVASPGERAAICRVVLRALPAWFGNAEANRAYARQVRGLPCFAAFVGGAVVGFLALRLQGEDAAEIHVMGVLPEQQRRGIGRQLVAQCEQFCLARGIFLLTVKTLADTHPSPSYAKTRAFYASLGFVPQRITDEWGSGQPCLHMAKALEGEGIV